MAQTVVPARKKKPSFLRRLRIDISRHQAVYVMLLIVMVYFALFCYWPMYGNIIAFQKYKPLKGILGSKFVGFENFEKFFTSYYFKIIIQIIIYINCIIWYINIYMTQFCVII